MKINKNKTALIFGAGSIGRGFIAELMYMSDYDVILVDIDKELINKLCEAGYYNLKIVNNKATVIKKIQVKQIINANNVEEVVSRILEADIIFTAVGQNALKYLAKTLAVGLKKRQNPVNVVLCENMLDVHIKFRDYVLSNMREKNNIKKAGFLRASVGRMVPLIKPGEDILSIKAEPYYHLPFDSDGIVGDSPDFLGSEPISPFDYAIERKLFIHNLGHAASAWMGAKKGYEYIYEAIVDYDIRTVVWKSMMEAANALAKKYNKNIKELTEHAEDLLGRFENVSLGDTVSRVGRDTLRKLSPNDRAVGALNLCIEMNLPYDNIAKVIAAGLQFANDDEGTLNVSTLLKEYGVDYVVDSICKVMNDKAHTKICEYYKSI